MNKPIASRRRLFLLFVGLPVAVLLGLLIGLRLMAHGADPVVDVAAAGEAGPTVGAVHFGGPDQPAGALSKLLLDRVNAAPPGSRIDWATYYFRDRDLARALIRASRRGVRVTLCVDGDPRLDDANDAVFALLRQDGLNGGLVVRGALPDPLDALSGKLHLKLYAFSWPRPVAFVGSFNPSGDEQTDKATLEEIGDQDRGENLLVEVTGAGLVGQLVDHVALLAARGGSVDRFAAAENRVYRDRDTELLFFPRLRPYPVEDVVDRLGAGDRAWGAMSHLKGGMVDHLAAAARRGARVDLVVHDTLRRVPRATVRELTAAGVSVHRYRERGLPMHAKFFVLDDGGVITSYFGSLNYNRNSRWLNDELLVRSTDRALAGTLLARFATISAEAVDAD